MKHKNNIMVSLTFIVGMQTSNVMVALSWTGIVDKFKSAVNACKPDGMGVKGVKESGIVLDQFAKKHLPETGEIVKETSAKLGSQAAGKFAPALTIIAAGYAVGQLWSMGKDVKSYFWPSNEEIAHGIEVDEKLAQLVAKKAFKACLLKNVHSERNSSGIPCDCESMKQAYAMAAGHVQAEEITQTFNICFGGK